MSIKKQGLFKNFFYQFFYHVVVLLIPLIISPYLTRSLGGLSLGVFSYVNSIAYFFIVAANLGISKYGQRVIAGNTGNEIKLRKAFWSLYCLHLFVSIFVLCVYFVFVLTFVNDYFVVFLIEGIYVSSAIFDITWLFYGLENFKSVVIKNLAIRVIEFVFILLFVRTENDLLIYTIITATSILLGQAIMLPQAIRKIPLIKVEMQDIKEHFKPLLIFSIAVIAVSLYTVLDKTLLGAMTAKENVAYYEYANKIISLPRTFIVIIGTVIFPRACRMAENGETDLQQSYMSLSLIVVYFIGFSSLFGILAVGKELAIHYYGNNFSESGDVMMAMCAFPLVIGLGDIVRSQYLIPNKKDKAYTICITTNAIINVVLSMLFIPKYGVYGAIIGTFCAEIFGCVFQIIVCKKYIEPLFIVKKAIPFMLIGIIMYFSIIMISFFVDGSILSTIIKILFGTFVYILLSLIYIYLFEKNIWSIGVSKIKAKKQFAIFGKR